MNSEGFPLATTLVSASVAFSAVIGVAVFLVYKRMVLEADLNDSWWKVKWSEIKFADKQAAGKKSTTSLGSASQATLSSMGMTTTMTGASTGSAASSMNTTCANISGVLVGMYKASLRNPNTGPMHSPKVVCLLLKLESLILIGLSFDC